MAFTVSTHQALVALVGKAVAAEVLFTAGRYSAEEAAAIGLVNRVVPVAELEHTVVLRAHQHLHRARMRVRHHHRQQRRRVHAHDPGRWHL